MADSIREALTKAIAEQPDTQAVTETPEIVETPVETVDSSAHEADKSAVSEQGSDVSGTSPQDGKSTPTPGAATSSQAAPASPSGASPSNVIAEHQAPASWNAKEKAHWASIPPEAKEAIRRRETEMRRAITASQEATAHKRNFDESIHQFEPLLKEKGVTDVMGQVIKPLMQLRAGLEIGTPEQKAGIIASIVRDFGVGIEALDAALTQMHNNGGLQPRPAPPKFDPRQVPELAPLYAMAEQVKRAQEAKAEAAVAEVTALPHFEEVRGLMADIYERATKEGKQITVLDAYDRALAFNGLEPRIKPQINVSEAAAALARSRNAASSVSGAPKTAPGKKPTTLREQIASAMNSQ